MLHRALPSYECVGGPLDGESRLTRAIQLCEHGHVYTVSTSDMGLVLLWRGPGASTIARQVREQDAYFRHVTRSR